MRSSLTLALIALSLLPAAAQAAEQPCLTSAEFAALSAYALPSVISGTVQRCSTSLPAEAYLRRSGTDLAARYAQGKQAAWPGAKAAVIKLGAGEHPEAAELMKSLPDATLQQLADAMIISMVGQRLPVERCGVIDHLVRLLAPLPAASTAELIGVAAGLASRTGRASFGKLSICEAG